MSNKKKEIRFEKMDVMSRRRFIRNLGFFLGTISVTSVVRLETMEKVSRKLLGGSLAYAQGASDIFNIHVYDQGGYPMRSLFPYVGDETAFYPEANQQYTNAQISSFATANNPMVLSDGSMPLQPYVNTMQAYYNSQNMGHRAPLAGAPYNAGDAGNHLIWHKEQYGADTLMNVPYFGSKSDQENQSLPMSKAASHPDFHSSIESLLNNVSQEEFFTRNGRQLTEQEKQGMFDIIANKLNIDIDKALKAESGEIMKTAKDTSISGLKIDLRAELDPANGGALFTGLQAGLPDNPSSGVDPAEAVYSALKAFENGLIPNAMMLKKRSGDWHGDREFNGSDPNARQIRHANYNGQLFRNILDSAGSVTHPVTGNPIKINIVFTSEFFRGRNLSYDGSGNSNNNTDGGTAGFVIMSSDATAFGNLKAGTFGSQDTSNGQNLFADSSGNFSSNGSMTSHASMRLHMAKACGLDESQIEETADDLTTLESILKS